MRTRADKRGNRYVINGSKTFISNGYLAGVVLMVCKTDPTLRARGASILIVETSQAKGYRVGRVLDKIGLKAQDTSELFFDDVEVPEENLLGGAEDQGFFQLMSDLPYERTICDIRLLTPDARMNVAFIRIGLSGCDVGVSYFLPRMVGASVAAEYMLTGRFLTAQRALGLGLASRVDELPALEQEAAALSADMLAATPLGLRLTKEALAYTIDAPSLQAAITLEDRNQVLCTQGEDFSEGIAAFLDKRAPRYGDQAGHS